MPHHVYILHCSDDTLYIGSTPDLDKRLHAHNNLKTAARYTRARRPVSLAYSESFETKSEALKRESTLKKLTRAEKLLLVGLTKSQADTLHIPDIGSKKLEAPNTSSKQMLRKLTKKDWQAFKTFRLFGLKESPDAFSSSYNEEVQFDDKYWQDCLSQQGKYQDRYYVGIFDTVIDTSTDARVSSDFLSEKSEKLVAVAGTKRESRDRWTIMAVYTDPDYRGKGYGKCIIEYILNELKKAGTKKADLYVNTVQETAVQLYERIGFEVKDVLKDYRTRDGRTQDDYRMEINLL